MNNHSINSENGNITGIDLRGKDLPPVSCNTGGVKAILETSSSLDIGEFSLLTWGVDTLTLSLPGVPSDVFGLYFLGLLEEALAAGVSRSHLQSVGLAFGDFSLRWQGSTVGHFCSLWYGRDTRIFFSRSSAHVVTIEIGAATCALMGADFGDFVLGLLKRIDIDIPLSEVRITRLDAFMDIGGSRGVGDITADGWREGWISRARKKSVIGDSRVETFYDGVRGSRGSGLHSRVYDKLREIEQGGSSSKLSWMADRWGLSVDTLPSQVTRWEVEIRPRDCRLPVDTLDKLSESSLRAVFAFMGENYRLTVPNSADRRTRWEVHPFWHYFQLATAAIAADTAPLVRSAAVQHAEFIHPSSIAQWRSLTVQMFSEIGNKTGLGRAANMREFVMLLQEVVPYNTDDLVSDARTHYQRVLAAQLIMKKLAAGAVGSA